MASEEKKLMLFKAEVSGGQKKKINLKYFVPA